MWSVFITQLCFQAPSQQISPYSFILQLWHSKKTLFALEKLSLYKNRYGEEDLIAFLYHFTSLFHTMSVSFHEKPFCTILKQYNFLFQANTKMPQNLTFLKYVLYYFGG